MIPMTFIMSSFSWNLYYFQLSFQYSDFPFSSAPTYRLSYGWVIHFKEIYVFPWITWCSYPVRLSTKSYWPIRGSVHTEYNSVISDTGKEIFCLVRSWLRRTVSLIWYWEITLDRCRQRPFPEGDLTTLEIIIVNLHVTVMK